LSRRLYLAGDRKRLVNESRRQQQPLEGYRTEWRRDYARLIHSAAFRRLQGKTQLFPNHESDFFRNRLTHSLEVAQIAKSIANRLNAKEKAFERIKIDTDLVETAALAHDLGHPPFGHNGEEALDGCMALHGGFEGNAQTLRILAKLEKKRVMSASPSEPVVGGRDNRAGLNLAARTLAAVLKYDNKIPRQRKSRQIGEVIKGYYYTEDNIIDFIKKNTLGIYNIGDVQFKTLECWIMDIADDIAYSTYDVEDALKGGFFTPIAMISAEPRLLERIAITISGRMKYFYGDYSAQDLKFEGKDVRDILIRVFGGLFELSTEDINSIKSESSNAEDLLQSTDFKAFLAARAQDVSNQLATIGYRRTEMTSELVGRFVQSIEFLHNPECLPLSKVRLKIDVFKEVETLKVFTYNYLIESSLLKLAEYSGKGIVNEIFERLNSKLDEKSYMLLPEDFRELHKNITEPDEKARVICDFIAGMTDRYAIDFYSRLTSPDSSNIWKPL
jgi:dGTPase